MTEYLVLVFIFWTVWMFGYLVGITQDDKSPQKPRDNRGVATRKMVDAGVVAYYEFTKSILNTVSSNEPTRELVVKIYRAMKNAE